LHASSLDISKETVSKGKANKPADVAAVQGAKEIVLRKRDEGKEKTNLEVPLEPTQRRK